MEENIAEGPFKSEVRVFHYIFDLCVLVEDFGYHIKAADEL
jgi:hypothetical protein